MKIKSIKSSGTPKMPEQKNARIENTQMENARSMP
jgi:hypothetical protein